MVVPQTGSSVSSQGWRRVVPFDFYPHSVGTSDDLDLHHLMGQAEKKSVSMAYNSQVAAGGSSAASPLMAAMMQHQLPVANHDLDNNYRSVSMANYGGSQQKQPPAATASSTSTAAMMHAMQMMAQKQPHLLAAMMQYPGQLMHPSMISTHQQQQQLNHQLQSQQQNQYRSPMDSVHQMMAAQMAMQQQFANSGQSTDAHTTNDQDSQAETPAPVTQTGGNGDGGGKWTPMQQAMQLMQQHMSQASTGAPNSESSGGSGDDSANISDEIPRLPSSMSMRPASQPVPTKTSQLMQMSMAAAAAGSKSSGQTKTGTGTGPSALKIGERPQFDLSNFQLLSPTEVGKQKEGKAVSNLGGKSQNNSNNESPEQDLSGTASEVVSKTKDSSSAEQDLESQPEAQTTSVSNHNQQQQHQPKHHSAPHPIAVLDRPPTSKATSFSILGGRFKLTPYTQTLQSIWEPSKALLQQALGTFMSSGPQQAILGGPMGTANMAAMATAAAAAAAASNLQQQQMGLMASTSGQPKMMVARRPRGSRKLIASPGKGKQTPVKGQAAKVTKASKSTSGSSSKATSTAKSKGTGQRQQVAAAASERRASQMPVESGAAAWPVARSLATRKSVSGGTLSGGGGGGGGGGNNDSINSNHNVTTGK